MIDEFVSAFRLHRTSAILRCHDAQLAHAAMSAAVMAGIRVIEFTLTTPGAYELIAAFAGMKVSPSGGLSRLWVGAGTVLDREQAERAVAAGATFLVSPVVDVEVIAAARGLNVAMMPGTATPTEMLTAHRAGASLCKLFPAPAGGPAWVRACMGPLPFLRVVPTQGVDADNLAAWIDAGAWAAGFVGSLFDPEDLRRGAVAAIGRRARAIRLAAEAIDARG